MHRFTLGVILLLATPVSAAEPADVVGASSLRGKVLCGYQGWFRCPGDAANVGWVHWSRDGRRIAPETLTFEMWPDVSELASSERHAAPGFTHTDGRPAELFSSDDPATVLRHFRWMKENGIDGAWLQQFLVDLRGDPSSPRSKSHRRVLDHVRLAANETGRAWAITFDIAGMPNDRIYDTLTREWKRLVDEGVTRDPRYIHEKGRPVVEVFGFFKGVRSLAMTPELANKLVDFFHAPGPYQAYVVGSGDWNWRRNFDPAYRAALFRLDAFAPWNVGNASKDAAGLKHANMRTLADDRREFERDGRLWLPVIYPGFSWDNLQRKPAGSTIIPRRGGMFLWEQFAELKRLGVDSAFVAMFDEVDEGTAIFKVTNDPPRQAHFVSYEGLPSDWYLRLIGEGTKWLRGDRPMSAEIPIKP
ncbi:MAG TPA: glycoside hydrolase family 71/99-like protein [Isosphaeraceae bacterium]